MPVKHIKYFGGGIAKDYLNAGNGQFSMSKDFDIFGFPNRLQPTRTIAGGTEPDNTLIGNMITGSNGYMFGVGTDPNNPAYGKLYRRAAYGSGNVWASFTNSQLSGAAVNYDFLVDWADSGASTGRNIFWASNNLLVASNPSDTSYAQTQALTFSNIGQGLVHPKDRKLYFPYQTSSATLIGVLTSNATDFGGLSYWSAFPHTRFRAYCLSYYGNDLAIPFTSSSGGGAERSFVGIWDRDTSLTTLKDTIPWGDGNLKILNNLNGVLIGISEYLNVNEGTPHSSDTAKILIRGYGGGSESTPITEIVVPRVGTTTPSTVLNTRVNYIHNDRLYFSVNLVGGGTDYYGLFSVGKNSFGQWTIVLEKSTSGACLASASTGEFISLIDTTAGSIKSSVYNSAIDGISFNTTSSFESEVNPMMSDEEKRSLKVLKGLYVSYLPLPSNAHVLGYYRIDGLKSGAWTELFDESTANSTYRDKVTDYLNNAQITKGRNIEFKLESMGGAIITAYGYSFDIEKSQI